MDVRFLQSGDLELVNINESDFGEVEETLTKPVRAGFIYPVLKVVYNYDRSEADIHFPSGVARAVSAYFFEIHGSTVDADGNKLVHYT